MSRKIDVSDPSSLSEEDVLYLQERGQPLPEGVTPVLTEDPSPPDLSDVPYTGDENTVADDTPQPLSAERYGVAGLPELRAELQRRDLPVTGKKLELISRLQESDSDPVLSDDSEE